MALGELPELRIGTAAKRPSGVVSGFSGMRLSGLEHEPGWKVWEPVTHTCVCGLVPHVIVGCGFVNEILP